MSKKAPSRDIGVETGRFVHSAAVDSLLTAHC